MIVWLASYPRSGNTFVRILIKSTLGYDTYSIYGKEIVNSGELNNLITKSKERISEDIEAMRESKDIYFIKTHGKYTKNVIHDKVIYIIRDGREATESYFHYQKEYGKVIYTKKEIMTGTPIVSTWSNHIEHWNKLVSKKDLLLLKFEDLVKDPINEIGKISNFLGIPIINTKVPLFKDLQSKNPKFFRSGKTNSWRESWNPDELEYFNAVNGATFKRYGYKVSLDKPAKDLYILMETIIHLNNKVSHNIKDLSEKIETIEKYTKHQIKNLNKKIDVKDKKIRSIENSISFKIGRIISSPIITIRSMLKILINK